MYRRWGKRLLDTLIARSALIVLSLLLAILALLVAVAEEVLAGAA